MNPERREEKPGEDVSKAEPRMIFFRSFFLEKKRGSPGSRHRGKLEKKKKYHGGGKGEKSPIKLGQRRKGVKTTDKTQDSS